VSNVNNTSDLNRNLLAMLFKVALEQSYSSSRIQYMWTLFSPSGTVICYSTLYDLPNEALHNAELFVKHFTSPGSFCQLDSDSVEKITGLVPSAPSREVKRAFTLIKSEDPE
jgi:hypothetical protein